MREEQPTLRQKLAEATRPGLPQDLVPRDELLEQQPFAASELKSINGASILLAEDSLLMQELATFLLEHAGAKVRIANNGQEALNLARRVRFDCVLMDIQMPVMNGLEATRQLRADPSMEGLKIIAISTDTRQADRALCLAAGMDDFIAKPFSARQLFTTIAKWLPQRLHGDTVAEPTLSGEPETGEATIHSPPVHRKSDESA